MINLDALRQYGATAVVRDFTVPQTDSPLISAQAGKRITVWGILFSTSHTGKFKLKSDGTSDLTSWLYFNANNGLAGDMTYLVCNLNEALTIDTDITGGHGITVWVTYS